MRIELVREYRFESAHHLPRVPPGHRCSRVHGHSFRFEVAVEGEVDPATGWLMDFAQLDDLVMPLVGTLDHRLLNDIEGLENPTSENLAKWMFDRLRPSLPELRAITLWETHDARCVYRGE